MTRFIRFTLATAAMALASAGASALEPRSGVKLRALDKITGNSTDLTAKVGETLKFGRVSVTVRARCQAPPEDTPESAAFLEIHALAAESKRITAAEKAGKIKPDTVILEPTSAGCGVTSTSTPDTGTNLNCRSRRPAATMASSSTRSNSADLASAT